MYGKGQGGDPQILYLNVYLNIDNNNNNLKKNYQLSVSCMFDHIYNTQAYLITAILERDRESNICDKNRQDRQIGCQV